MKINRLYDKFFKNNLVARFTDKYIDPIDSLTEIFFSVMIVLIFTLAYNIIASTTLALPNASEDSTLKILIGALGAVIAWGIIDGVIYAVLSLFEREEMNRFLSDALAAESEQERIEIVEQELDELLAQIVREDQKVEVIHAISQRLKAPQGKPAQITKDDLLAGVSHLIIAVITVIPSLLPLLIFSHNSLLAIRISTGVSILILFITGMRWGKYTGVSPFRTGFIIALVAILLSFLAILLGG